MFNVVAGRAAGDVRCPRVVRAGGAAGERQHGRSDEADQASELGTRFLLSFVGSRSLQPWLV